MLCYFSNVGWNIPNDRFMPQLSNLTKNEIVLPPKHGGKGGGEEVQRLMANAIKNIHIIFGILP